MAMKDICIIELADTYSAMGYKTKYSDARWLEGADLSGTNCYLDDDTKVILKERLEDIPYKAMHFLGSGNYHYLSLFFLEKIDRPFSLVMIDHHPDCQMPGFGEITSCGGWLLEAIQHIDNLQKVYMIGADEKLYNDLELESELASKIVLISKQALSMGDGMMRLADALALEDNSVYISFDKDALAEAYAITDWDCGNMSIEDVFEVIKLLDEKDILGVDICGDSREKEDDGTNAAINEKLIQYFKGQQAL